MLLRTPHLVCFPLTVHFKATLVGGVGRELPDSVPVVKKLATCIATRTAEGLG
jgi:hypothetical protein